MYAHLTSFLTALCFFFIGSGGGSLVFKHFSLLRQLCKEKIVIIAYLPGDSVYV